MIAEEPLLRVDRLTVAYAGQRSLFRAAAPFLAVKDASFAVAAGETFGLVGESGSGKTTIGRAILRLTPTQSGSIRFDGADIAAFGSDAPIEYRRNVQMIFQDPRSSLNPRHRIARILDQVIARHRPATREARKAIVAELLDRVQLSSYHGDRYPAELSGGQRQRVAIAHALATDPRLIVCDEAVSALDVSTQSQILNLLQDLQERFGISYLFISHDLAIVRHMSRRIAVMYLGRIVEIGATEMIYEAPRHPYTQMLLASVLKRDPVGRVERRAARRQLLGSALSGAPAAGCPFQPRCGLATTVCAREAPPLRVMPDGGRVACHAVA